MSQWITTRVLPNDLCIGCGACAFQDAAVSGMRLDTRGQYIPVIGSDRSATPRGDRVCPFSGQAQDESTLAEQLFASQDSATTIPSFNDRIGYYQQVMVGHADTENFRLAGSSGGLTNWLLHELFRRGDIDAVIGVGELVHAPGETNYGYMIINEPGELGRLAKSKYYPVTLDEVLEQAVSQDKRFAFVGVPCFVKTMRNLCRDSPKLNARIRFCIAIVCGHLKSRAFAESLGWQVGIAPEKLDNLDFRVKVPEAPANRYAIEARGDGRTVQRQVFDLYGSDWGLGFFKYKACDYCDDIAAETADIVLGDAWLPVQVQDWRGHNIVVVRDPYLAVLLSEAKQQGHIFLKTASAEDFVQSQAANYRHRHDGLALRLYDDQAAGHWTPPKRIAPCGDALPKGRKQAIRLRSQLRERSHSAFIEAKQRGRFKVFPSRMRRLVLRYHWQAGSLTKYLIKQGLIILRRFIRIKV